MNTTQKIDSIIKELTSLKIELDCVQPATPCNRKGWKVGDVFIVEDSFGGSGDAFSNGSIVELFKDDASEVPMFKLLRGYCKWTNADGQRGGFTNIRNVRKVAP